MWSHALVRSIWSHIGNCLGVDERTDSYSSLLEMCTLTLRRTICFYWKNSKIIGKACVFQFFQWFSNFSNKTLGFSNFPMILVVLEPNEYQSCWKPLKSLENWKTLWFYWKNWKIIGKIGKPYGFIGKVYKSLERLAFSNFSNDFQFFQIKP